MKGVKPKLASFRRNASAPQPVDCPVDVPLRRRRKELLALHEAEPWTAPVPLSPAAWSSSAPATEPGAGPPGTGYSPSTRNRSSLSAFICVHLWPNVLGLCPWCSQRESDNEARTSHIGVLVYVRQAFPSCRNPQQIKGVKTKLASFRRNASATQPVVRPVD